MQRNRAFVGSQVSNWIGSTPLSRVAFNPDVTLVRASFDGGTFVNGSNSYIVGTGFNNTDGITLVGAASNPSPYNNWSAYIRWDYNVDFSKYKTLTFYGRKDAGNGNVKVMITDGLTTASGTTVYAQVDVNYASLSTGTWYSYSIDTSAISGTKKVSFIGGYTDSTGASNSSTSYSNIKFIGR